MRKADGVELKMAPECRTEARRAQAAPGPPVTAAKYNCTICSVLVKAFAVRYRRIEVAPREIFSSSNEDGSFFII